jgi:GNAT superfamily N-acetyltransferase
MGYSMAKLIIRKARMRDKCRIIELLSELGRPEPKQREIKRFAGVVRKYITNNDKTILVAETDSNVIGIISLVFLLRLNRTRPEAWVPDFIVDQQYRDKGIGRELLKRCIWLARKQKCWRIRLETGLSRTRSQKFYKMMKMKPFALAFTLPL